MKTISEIKDEVAEQAGYKTWDSLMYAFAGFGSQIQPYNDKVAKLYAEEALKEAAEMCDDFEDRRGEHKVYILNIIKELK